MGEKQYSISEFAIINKVTPRMLRYYDKIGLFHPASLLENGYRVYTSAQIEIVSSIRLFQNCGFTLAEIMTLFEVDETELTRMAKEKLAELDQSDKAQQAMRIQLLKLTKHFPKAYTNYYDISYVQHAEQLLLCSLVPIAEAEIEAAMEQLHFSLSIHVDVQDGFYMLLSDLEGMDTFRVAVPVNMRLSCDGYENITLKAGWYLSTMHHGDYYNIGIAYDRLLCFAQEQGYSLSYPFLERYLLDEENTTCPAQYLTQILIRFTP